MLNSNIKFYAELKTECYKLAIDFNLDGQKVMIARRRGIIPKASTFPFKS